MATNQFPDLICLQGLTNYGDSVEDEWLIVFLLRELSKQFLDLWIKVIDTDGEFLLIEAANALPRWLNPEIADNRVWINNSQLKIIGLAARDESEDVTIRIEKKALALPKALSIIKAQPCLLSQNQQLEDEAFYRLRNYPKQISASLHHALITISRKLAYILHECPAAIAPATEAFYLRDPIGLKPLQTSTSSTLTFPPTDLVMVSVRFTKVLYAQLKSQLFDAPPLWKSLLLEAEKGKTDTEVKAKESLELGMKVTSGFEMLLSDGIKRDNRQVRTIQVLLEDLDAGEPLPRDREIAEWKDVKREDGEEWLDIDFEDFEAELQGKSAQNKKNADNPSRANGEEKPIFGPPPPGTAPGTPRNNNGGFGDSKTQADLKKMVERFESFLKDEDAGIDGAEMDDMDHDDDEDEDEEMGSDEAVESDSEDDETPVLDPREFAKMMREMMGLQPEMEDIEDLEDNVPEIIRQGIEGGAKVEELNSDDEEEDEAEELRKVMEQMDAELRESGALDLDPKPMATPKNKLVFEENPDKLGLTPVTEKRNPFEKKDWESESGDEMDIDFNLAKNLLESFKSQAGMAGPGGNLIGMMGMQLPRDEGEGEEEDRGRR